MRDEVNERARSKKLRTQKTILKSSQLKRTTKGKTPKKQIKGRSQRERYTTLNQGELRLKKATTWHVSPDRKPISVTPRGYLECPECHGNRLGGLCEVLL